MCRSPTCSASARTTRRWDTVRRTSGRTTPRCRSARCPGRCPAAGSGWSRPRLRFRRAPATRARGALQRQGEVLLRSTRATPASTPTCGSRMSPSTASTPRPRIRRRTSRWQSCVAAPRRAASARWRRAFTARRPTAAIARRWRSMARRSWPRCRADAVDAAILVPNCPVCHQTVSLVARLLEQSGIASVVMGCAKDIVERVGVPRLAVLRLPARQLGRAAQGCRVASLHARACAAHPRGGPGPAHHGAVAAALERRSRLEARLLQHRPSRARRNSPPARRVRPGEVAGKQLREALDVAPRDEDRHA